MLGISSGYINKYFYPKNASNMFQEQLLSRVGKITAVVCNNGEAWDVISFSLRHAVYKFGVGIAVHILDVPEMQLNFHTFAF